MSWIGPVSAGVFTAGWGGARGWGHYEVKSYLPFTLRQLGNCTAGEYCLHMRPQMRCALVKLPSVHDKWLIRGEATLQCGRCV